MAISQWPSGGSSGGPLRTKCRNHDRAHVETATFQPFIIHNLPKGRYLRSTGTWTFDLKNDTRYIPVGLGVGKASKVGSNIYNLFVEPKFTLFAGINITFGH